MGPTNLLLCRFSSCFTLGPTEHQRLYGRRAAAEQSGADDQGRHRRARAARSRLSPSLRPGSAGYGSVCVGVSEDSALRHFALYSDVR